MALFELTELASWVQSDLDTATATLARGSATAYLEAETGVRLTQQADATIAFTPRWSDCWIDLPIPTTAVSAVEIDGEASTDWQLVNNRLYRRVGWGGVGDFYERQFAYQSGDDYVSVEVTLTYGFDTVPAEFKHWGLILAAQAYNLAPKVGLQSVRIDDYSETYATGGGQPYSAMSLPSQVLNGLRARYGKGAAVVETTQP